MIALDRLARNLRLKLNGKLIQILETSSLLLPLVILLVASLLRNVVSNHGTEILNQSALLTAHLVALDSVVSALENSVNQSHSSPVVPATLCRMHTVLKRGEFSIRKLVLAASPTETLRQLAWSDLTVSQVMIHSDA